MDSLDSHCLSEFKSQPHSLPAVCPDQSDPSFLCLGFLVCKHEDTGVKGIPQWRQEVLGEGPACSRCSLGAPLHHLGFSRPVILAFYHKASVIWAGSPPREENPSFLFRLLMKQSPPGPGVSLALLQHPLCSVNRHCQQGNVVLKRGSGRNITSCLPCWVFTKPRVMKGGSRKNPIQLTGSFLWSH